MKKTLLISALFALGITTSCTDFDELNINPDSTSKVTSEMIATQIMKDTYRFWNPNPTDYATANLWCKHTVLCETNPNPYQYYYSYWPYGGFDNFKKLTDVKRMVEYAEGTPQAASYKGLSLFMKAWWGFDMTLDMGDIPYSEAGKAEEGIFQPKYDKQADVFAYILQDLKDAAQYFSEGADFTGDIMLGGSVDKWERLCNAMQLKVLQTMSRKVTPEQKQRFAEIVSQGKLMKNNDNNFQLTYEDNSNASHPYYNGESKRRYHAISKLAADELKRLQDRRLFYFAEPAEALINTGLSENDFNAYEGAPSEITAEQLAINNNEGKYSLINKRYTLLRAGDPKLYFSYAEQCFIIAESIEEGWVSGNSQDYYENGVKAMLEYYMNLSSASSGYHGMPITKDYIDHYFEGAAAYATDKTERLHQIWMQRWLIDFFQGREDGNYAQFLRTGYPEFPLNPSTSMNPDDVNVYPKRWKYPTSEQVSNPVNYQKAIDDMGGYDGINITPWYLQ